MFGIDLGIDLGTASVLVYSKGKGIVMHEPSVVAINRNNNKKIAVGEDARMMLGRTPGNIIAIRPMRDGVIADTRQLNLCLIFYGKGRRQTLALLQARVVVCIPSGVTEVEERAVKQAAYQAGAKKVKVVEEPYAAALGSGLDISGRRVIWLLISEGEPQILLFFTWMGSYVNAASGWVEISLTRQ